MSISNYMFGSLFLSYQPSLCRKNLTDLGRSQRLWNYYRTFQDGRWHCQHTMSLWKWHGRKHLLVLQVLYRGSQNFIPCQGENNFWSRICKSNKFAERQSDAHSEKYHRGWWGDLLLYRGPARAKASAKYQHRSQCVQYVPFLSFLTALKTICYDIVYRTVTLSRKT